MRGEVPGGQASTIAGEILEQFGNLCGGARVMDDVDYEVGFGKPPKKSQFKKGQSGNPGGRRTRPRSLREEIMLKLDRKVAVPMPGKKTKQIMTVREIIATKLVQDAANGKPAALKHVLECEDSSLAGGTDDPLIEFTLKLEEDGREPKDWNIRSN
ncbi:DUF5681 domain-containing protein [Novosphingobium tardum]|uniref:DUF5681 domain-containing protein n=1 Tax=Novosphingobium tardum TaxID=1538021 RepID=A0ABV8RL26_9SPHN